jgi:oligosaccharide repeat unit polymerase
MLIRKLRPFDLLNPSIFFVWQFVVFLLFGAIINKTGVITLVEISNKTIFILLLYLSFFIISAFFLSNVLLMKRPQIIDTDIQYDLPVRRVLLFGMLFFVVGSVILLLLYYKMGVIPALAEDVNKARIEGRAGLGELSILGTAFLTTAVCFMSAYYDRLSRIFKIIYFLVLVVSLALFLGLAFRGHVAILLLTVLFVRYFLSDRYKRTLRVPMYFILYGIVSLFLLAAAEAVRSGGKLSLEAFAQLYWTLSVHAYNLSRIINLIPSTIDYYYGMTFINDFLVAIPGFKSSFLSVILFKIIATTQGESPTGMNMTITAPGEGYANLGIPGVVFHAVFLGLVSGISYNMLSQKNTLSSRIILLVLTLSLLRLVTGGIVSVFLFTLGPKLFLSLLFIYLAKNTFLRKKE